jgi:hypothetical protein
MISHTNLPDQDYYCSKQHAAAMRVKYFLTEFSKSQNDAHTKAAIRKIIEYIKPASMHKRNKTNGEVEITIKANFTIKYTQNYETTHNIYIEINADTCNCCDKKHMHNIKTNMKFECGHNQVNDDCKRKDGRNLQIPHFGFSYRIDNNKTQSGHCYMMYDARHYRKKEHTERDCKLNQDVIKDSLLVYNTEGDIFVLELEKKTIKHKPSYINCTPRYSKIGIIHTNH